MPRAKTAEMVHMVRHGLLVVIVMTWPDHRHQWRAAGQDLGNLRNHQQGHESGMRPPLRMATTAAMTSKMARVAALCSRLFRHGVDHAVLGRLFCHAVDHGVFVYSMMKGKKKNDNIFSSRLKHFRGGEHHPWAVAVLGTPLVITNVGARRHPDVRHVVGREFRPSEHG